MFGIQGSSGHTDELAICLGSEGDTKHDVTAACSVAGAWLVSTSFLGSCLTLLTLFCYRLNRMVNSERRVKIYDACARNCYVSGILHLCVCLCYWMVLSRTPYYFLLGPLCVGVFWILLGRKFTKWSDRLHDSERASQLLVNLLQQEDDQVDQHSNLNAPPGLFRVGPDEGYNLADIREQDLEAPDIDMSSEDGKLKLRVAHGLAVSDLSDDDLESFGSDDDVRSDEEMLDIPEAETPILVESETDSDYSDP